ncbi:MULTISPECIES: isoprenylcysteine carboxylmethyltransferase family protein [unclassified Haladaptatus]|uniref:methyltransferase family protein n=1 Tax=unclassified Haladaptatus TaxID=2622732 RepID=UPI0023E8E998|nr:MULTISPECIES: isoprenylcysteine carboxylmethyltransferase family protein [unclassified Haladaptatus]
MHPLARSALFTLVGPGTVAVLVPYIILTGFPPLFLLALGPFRYLGISLLLVGIGIYATTVGLFAVAGGTPAPIDEPASLVSVGLYQLVRNPMYVGILSIIFGEALFFESGLLAVYGIVVWLLFHVFIVAYEEPHLRKKFGTDYEHYVESTPRWFPRLPRQ